MTTHMVCSDDETEAACWHLPVHRIPTLVWREAGDEVDKRAVLIAHVMISELSLRFAAIGVHLEHTDDEGETTNYPVTNLEAHGFDGCILAFDEGARGFEVGELWHAFGLDGLVEHTEIEGRLYTIFAAPYCT